MNEYAESNSPSLSPDMRGITGAVLSAKVDYKKTGLGALNAHQKYKYAKLNQIYDAVEPALTKNLVNITHFRSWLHDRIFLVTRLIHSPTGQWMEDICPVESEKPGNQAHGSALTYLKKQAVLNLCAIYGEDDDDGEDEERYIENRQHEPEINDDQYNQLVDALQACADPADALRGILSYNKVKDIGHLKQSQFAGALHAVRSKPKKG